MAKKKKRNHLRRASRTALSMTGASLTMGVGATALGKMDTPAATSGAKGIGKMAGFMPTMGTVAGAGMAIGAVADIGKPLRRTKKKRRKGR